LVIVVAGGVLGLLIGSFLNVVAYRIPLDQSVVDPPSACPACGHRIRPLDNIPVVSWLLLRGRCRDCGAPISPRYAIVEISTAAIFAVAAVIIGSAWVLPAYWWFAGVSITLVLTDLDHQRIPNRILFPGFIVGAVLLTIGALLDGDAGALGRAAGGAAGYFGLLLGIAVAARGGFGYGDVKLAALLGLFLAYRSWETLVVGVFAAFVVGGLVSIGLLIARRAGRKDAIAFGPALVVGAFVAIAWGDAIADWYVG
jgi:leader peptidase (prepilin peptidase)/N-methyltransferase